MSQKEKDFLPALWNRLPDSVQVVLIILAVLGAMLLARYGYFGEI